MLALACYWPGLFGPFLLDDFANLDALGDLGGVRSWDTFIAFVLGGSSGPTGRPIALISFLLNAQDWPADPFWFKLTNLVIHIFNANLIFIISLRILEIVESRGGAPYSKFWVSLFCASFWLLHPYLVSTTLYVVQRMAQLSAFFCLLGILSYILGRSRILCGRSGGYCLAFIVTPICWGLAAFSKENGALLPIFVVLLELTIFGGSVYRIVFWRFRWLHFGMFIVPSFLIVGYIVSDIFINDPWVIYEPRGFSTIERLLSESRILFSYIGSWIYPDIGQGSLFQDDFPKSTGLFSPPQTLWSVLGHLVILVVIISFRRSLPLLTFCVGFFYAGHLIESTTIKLELYFDHRNYLPLAFLILPLVVFVAGKLGSLACGVIGFTTLILLMFMTYQTSSLWQSYESLVVSWAEKSQGSSRAQHQLSLLYRESGALESAISVVERYNALRPDDFVMRLWLLTLKCEARMVSEGDILDVQNDAKNAGYDLRALGIYTLFVDVASSRRCENLQYNAAQSILESHLLYSSNANPQGAAYSQINFLLGRLALRNSHVEHAIYHWKRSLAARGNPDAAMQFAAELASAGEFDAALDFSSIAEDWVRRGKLGTSGRDKALWHHDIGSFRQQVLSDKEVLLPGSNKILNGAGD